MTDMDEVSLRFSKHGWSISDAGCWEWNGSRNNQRGGYGQLNFRGKIKMVHRLAYELWVGPIPQGKIVCHSCDNPPCINPEHLFIGTHADNAQDKVKKGRARGGSLRGEKCPWAKLTQVDVNSVREALSDGQSLTSIGRRFGVTKQAIAAIRDGRTWTQ